MYRKALVMVCLLVSLLVVLSIAMGKAPKTSTGEPQDAIDFTLTDINGKMHTLSQYRGKVVFLNFWATWCPPCRAEMPSMQKMFEVSDKKKFAMLAVSVREPEGRVLEFIKKNGYTFSILIDPSGSVADKYRVFAYPTTFVIDEEGKFIARISGARQWSWKDFKKLLK